MLIFQIKHKPSDQAEIADWLETHWKPNITLRMQLRMLTKGQAFYHHRFLHSLNSQAVKQAFNQNKNKVTYIQHSLWKH